jgi:RNA polymerase sigma factor (sigma-70 family)
MEMEDSQIVSNLKKRDNAAYNLLYTFYYPIIERFVTRNNGSVADAQDVFQETIIVLLDKVPKKDFILTSSIKTYIFAVASNIWLKRLRDAKKFTEINNDHDQLEDLSLSEWEQREDQRVQRNKLQRILQKITRHCFVFLTKTFITGATRDQLIQALGYKNSHTFDNQKYKCLEQARKSFTPKGD